MEDEVTVLMCLPVEGDPSRYIVPGSIPHQCDDCGIKVWVAPSGQQLISERTVIVVCPGCALDRMSEEPGDIEITGEQAKEIEAWGKRN